MVQKPEMSAGLMGCLARVHPATFATLTTMAALIALIALTTLTMLATVP